MNKSIIKLFAAITIVSALLTGCGETDVAPERTGDAPSTIESKPTEEHFIIAEATPKTPNKVTKTQDGEKELKSLTIEEIRVTQLERIDKDAADKMEAVFVNAKDRHLKAYDTELEYIADVEDSALPLETKIDYTLLRNDGRAISVLEDIVYYSAKVEEGRISFAYNFYPVTGESIGTNIFYKAGDKKSLDEADNQLFEKLVAAYGQDAIKYENLNQASYVDEAQDTWYFTENGIKVFFNAGDIADASLGVLEVEYTKDELPEFAQKYFN